MFDVSSIKRRYFTVKIGDLVIDVEPPKIKVLKKITSLVGPNAKKEKLMDDLAGAVKLILNKNKAGSKIGDDIIDELDFDQLEEILLAFFNWVAKERNSKN